MLNCAVLASSLLLSHYSIPLNTSKESANTNATNTGLDYIREEYFIN